jgi:SAM-dependent methyltransferase
VAGERRLSFGGVAAMYDRFRPSYPDALVDDVIAFAGLRPGDRAVEVGAGTGKATALFAARGVHVVALEPSAEMAAVARGRDLAGVELLESGFEDWDPRGATFPLVYSAQAWHWVAPEVRFAKARAVLRPGGALAIFFTRPRWSGSPLYEELDRAYVTIVPDAGPMPGPMRPMIAQPELWGDWERELHAVDSFEKPDRRTYVWECEYTTEEYTSLLQTHSDHILLSDDDRRRLLGAVAEIIDRAGGGFTLTYATDLWLVRASR